MTDAALNPPESPPRKKRGLVMVVAGLALAGAGFASTYLDLWSPTRLIGEYSVKGDVAPQMVFADIPAVELTIPGGRGRTLTIAASIQTDAAHQSDIQHQMPRILDAFTGFLSEVDPAAYDKRGVLEIIRAELLTRTRAILGEAVVADLLITEFRIK